VSDGRFGVCRVLQVVIPEQSRSPQALVALSDWIDHAPPPLAHRSVRKILHLTHHLWSNRPELIWVGQPPPLSFRKIGSVPILKKDVAASSGSYSAWESLPLQLYLQWRWDHDRDALLLEDAAKKEAEEVKRREAAIRHAHILATVSLKSLLELPDLFPFWDDYPPSGVKKAIEQTIRTFIKAINTPNKISRRDATRELRRCVDVINKIDADNNHPIETEEREDLFELFEQIFTAARHPDLLDKADQWRDW